MTNSQSKMMMRINHIPAGSAQMSNLIRKAGLASKYSKVIRIKIEEERDNGDIRFWNKVVEGKKNIYST